MTSPTYHRFITTTGGRRFLLSLLSLASITFLNAYGTLDSTAFAIALGATVAAYITGDTYQKVATTSKKDKSNEHSQPE